MSNASLMNIDKLQSFIELTDRDQVRVYDSYINEPLEERQIENKYLKRTSSIQQRAPFAEKDNECFLTFDEYELHRKYSTLIFSLCGISHYFHFVLYVNIMDNVKMKDRAQFLCDILANLLKAEIPNIKKFPLKFILCHDDELANQALELFATSEKTAHLYNAFLFVRESRDLRNAQLHDPYVQRAWAEIMHTTIMDTNMREVFHPHLKVAEIKQNMVLHRFTNDYQSLARDLLSTRSEVNLGLCTMERTENFESIIRVHIKDFKEPVVTRQFLFELLRALIVIYDY